MPPGEAPLPLASPTLSPVLTPASTARPAPPLSDPALARPGGPGTSTPAIGTEAVLKNEVLLKQLDKLKEEVSAKPGLTAKVAGTVTVGAAVSVGYLLLTGRALLWLLLALTARSTWKQFDPLEILNAWEKKRARGKAGAADAETLQSLVERNEDPGPTA